MSERSSSNERMKAVAGADCNAGAATAGMYPATAKEHHTLSIRTSAHSVNPLNGREKIILPESGISAANSVSEEHPFLLPAAGQRGDEKVVRRGGDGCDDSAVAPKVGPKEKRSTVGSVPLSLDKEKSVFKDQGEGSLKKALVEPSLTLGQYRTTTGTAAAAKPTSNGEHAPATKPPPSLPGAEIKLPSSDAVEQPQAPKDPYFSAPPTNQTTVSQSVLPGSELLVGTVLEPSTGTRNSPTLQQVSNTVRDTTAIGNTTARDLRPCSTSKDDASLDTGMSEKEGKKSTIATMPFVFEQEIHASRDDFAAAMKPSAKDQRASAKQMTSRLQGVNTQTPNPARKSHPDISKRYTLNEAAVIAAEEHLKWAQQHARKQTSQGGPKGTTQSTTSNKGGSKVKLSPQGTARKAKKPNAKLTASARPSSIKPALPQHLKSPSSKRKLSLPLRPNHGVSVAASKRRKSLPEAALPIVMAPTRSQPQLTAAEQLALLTAAFNRAANGGQVVPGLTQTLQESATRAPAPQNRHSDKPMTYLVRQLLGQVAVDKNDPAFVLSPQLVKNAANKIQMVIDKLIEAAVSRVKEKGGDTPAPRVDTGPEVEHVKQNIQVLTQLAQDQALQTLEQNKIIAELQRKLDENLVVINSSRNELELLRLRVKRGASTDDPDHDETVRTLVQKLHRVIATVQKLKKDIEGLRLVAKQDDNELQEKEAVIQLLRAMVETETLLGGRKPAGQPPTLLKSPPRTDHRNHSPDKVVEKNQSEIALLTQEVGILEDALQKQRESGEQSMRSYMRAAVHSLQTRQSSRKRKSTS